MADADRREEAERRRPLETTRPRESVQAHHDSIKDEVLFGRQTTLKVFISSVMRGGVLSQERVEAARVADAHPDAHAWYWERDANAGPYCSLKVCTKQAATSDVLVLIVAGDITDVTEAEWRAALTNGVTCVLLAKRGVTQSARLQAFISAERSNGIDVSFETLEDLRVAVADSLRQCIADGVRRRSLSRRWGHRRPRPTTHLVEVGVEQAEQHYFAGSIEVASELLDEVEAIVGENGLRDERLDLVSGLVHGALGSGEKAKEAYARVIDNRRSSRSAVAYAHQNLGLEVMREGDVEQARELMREAMEMHQSEDDWFGVLQTLLNLAVLEVDAGELTRAKKLNDLAKQLLAYFDPPLHSQLASTVGLDAHLAAKGGDHGEALKLYQRALRMMRRAKEVEGEAVSAQNVGAAYLDLGRNDLAKKWALRALEAYERLGNVWRQEEAHRLLAIIALAGRRLDEAESHFQSALALALSMDDTVLAARLSADLGAVRVDTGHPDAVANLDWAFPILHAAGEGDWLDRIDLNRAALAADRGDSDEAVDALERVVRRTEDSSTASEAHERIAVLSLLEPMDVAKAIRHMDLALQEEDSPPAEQAMLAATFAKHLEDADRPGEGLELFDRALTLVDSQSGGTVWCDIVSDRALLLAELGRSHEALVDLESCVQQAEAMNDTERQIRALHNVGELSRREGDVDRSVTALTAAIDLASRAGDDEAKRSATGLLAIARNTTDETAQARDLALTLLEESQAARDRKNAAVALGVLAGAAFRDGDYVGAADLYRQASRREQADSVRFAEDLCGIAESHSAANRWRPTVRAVQKVVDHAQAEGLEGLAWGSLLRAARWYLSRGQIDHAATITTPAWVLASQSPSEIDAVDVENEDEDSLARSEFFQALVTSAFHVRWELGADSSQGWDFFESVIARFDVDDDATKTLREFVTTACEVASEVDDE